MKKAVFIITLVLFAFAACISGINCTNTARTNGQDERQPAGSRESVEYSTNSNMRDETRPVNYEETAVENPGQAGKVLICKSKKAYAYHSHSCKGLKKCKAGTASMTREEAENSGYKACKFCY